MKQLLFVSILLLLGAGILMAITSELRQQPAVPMNPSITRSGETITLTWDAVTEDLDGSPITVISYKVYSSDIPDFVCNDENLIETVTGTELVLGNETGSLDLAFFKVVAEGAADTPPVPEGFVYVPGGTFTMGDTRGGGYINELPTHSVTLGSFYMGKYEVTQSEWQAVMGSNPASGSGVGANYPVYYVSWYAILKYCNLRSMAEGLTPVYTISGSTNPASWGSVPTSGNGTWNAALCNFNANGYRLPTEAEWEYAARGATNVPDYLYSGSDNINAVAWHDGNSGSTTHIVGTKAPNALGLYDMSGNVFEWCWDWYSTYYYSSSPSDNPTGPASGSYRVLRGGGWYNSAIYCRVAYRRYVNPYFSNYYIGFRLCRAVL